MAEPQTATSPQQSGAARLADRLRDVKVDVRRDLETTRTLFRGEPSYIVRDPLTFQSVRFDPEDYDVLVRIDSRRALGEVFQELVDEGRASAQDEEKFYQFVFGLHRSGFLHLPVADDKLLYRRWEAKRRARRREKAMGFLFLRIPLWNPDTFLERTVRFARPLFSRFALVAWLLLMAGAIAVGWLRRGELSEPLEGVLAAQNLPLIWLSLVALKIIHEFGHAYACKHFGGHVPEMGVYLIAFTPCAYVDATACWGLSSKVQRLIVCLGGMYFELAVAATATFVWAATNPGLLHSLAFNVIFLAGVVTVLFNINPLMRYDGYYVLSDLLEIPNLRSRATAYLKRACKRRFLGLKPPGESGSRTLKAVLLGFGVFSSLYKLMILIGIAALVATKLYFIGIGIAVAYIGMTVVGMGGKLVRYLCLSEETAPVRMRAVSLAGVALIGIPVAIGLLPLPVRVQAQAVVGCENECVARARTPGFVEQASLEEGQQVSQSAPLTMLSNDDARDNLRAAQANLAAAELRFEGAVAEQKAEAAVLGNELEALRTAVAFEQERLSRLIVRAPLDGTVVNALDGDLRGRYFQTGDPLATIVAGEWRIRTLLTADQLSACRPAVGERAWFRCAADPTVELPAKVVSVEPAGTRKIRHPSLTHLAGGDIAVDPRTGEASEPYFEVTLAIAESHSDVVQYGMTGRVRFKGPPEPLGTLVARKVRRFVNLLSRA